MERRDGLQVQHYADEQIRYMYVLSSTEYMLTKRA